MFCKAQNWEATSGTTCRIYYTACIGFFCSKVQGRTLITPISSILSISTINRASIEEKEESFYDDEATEYDADTLLSHFTNVIELYKLMFEYWFLNYNCDNAAVNNRVAR